MENNFVHLDAINERDHTSDLDDILLDKKRGSSRVTKVVKSKTNKTNVETPIITSTQYYAEPQIITKYKIDDLRKLLKHYKGTIQFKISPKEYGYETVRFLKERFKVIYDFALIGTKPKLTERIVYFFNLDISARQIQKNWRRYMVLLIGKLRGPAVKDRSMCVNETDFYTLEPLVEIHNHDFFSFRDKNNFVYGFETDSLLNCIKHQKRFVKNPYTRDSMQDIVPNILKLVRMQMIIQMNQEMANYAKRPSSCTNVLNTVRNPLGDQQNNITEGGGGSAQIISQLSSTILPSLRAMEHPSHYNSAEMVLNIRGLRCKSFQERVEHIFMEIHHLGHYVDSRWFLNLERRDFIRFFRCLYDIWHYRAGISLDIKIKICPLWDPFVMINPDRINYIDISLLDIQLLSVSVMEYMIFTGIDDEYRMLGTFHVLTAMTIVSPEARANMLWLYESILY